MSSLRFNRLPDEIIGVRMSGDLAGPAFLILGMSVNGVQAYWRGKTRETFLVVMTRDDEETDKVARQFQVGDFSFAVHRSIVIQRPITVK
jgi:hypothetical protein